MSKENALFETLSSMGILSVAGNILRLQNKTNAIAIEDVAPPLGISGSAAVISVQCQTTATAYRYATFLVGIEVKDKLVKVYRYSLSEPRINQIGRPHNGESASTDPDLLDSELLRLLEVLKHEQ